MARTLSAAMRQFETGSFDEAAAAFASLAGPSREGVIARFRRAEALSRLGRHEEALEDARRAFEDAPGEPPAPLWYAQALAEAGRFDDAAGVAFPVEGDPEMTAIARGFAALAHVAADVRDDPADDVVALLETRHSPLFSLALRAAERHRLTGEPRWGDLFSVNFAIEALAELDDAGKRAHAELELPTDTADVGSPPRWVRLAELSGGWTEMFALLKPDMFLPRDADEARLEEDLALGRLDEADAALAAAAEKAGKKPDASLCIDTTRARQLRGARTAPKDAPGFEQAERHMREAVSWLDLGVALVEDRPVDARPLADGLADPSHEEYVRAALYRWALPR